MKKTTKILIAIACLLTAIAINAQQQCAIICHNGTLVKAIGGNAIDGHLNHHASDVLISTDCNYEIIGDECESLSLPKLDFKVIVPTGLFFSVYDNLGKVRLFGVTSRDFFKTLPIGEEIFYLEVEGYQIMRYIKTKD